MFYKELYDNVYKTKHTTYLNCNRLTELEKTIQEKEQHIKTLEKRINNIADYIQGKYTEEINENFKKIENTFDLLTQNIKKELNNLKTKKTKKVK